MSYSGRRSPASPEKNGESDWEVSPEGYAFPRQASLEEEKTVVAPMRLGRSEVNFSQPELATSLSDETFEMGSESESSLRYYSDDYGDSELNSSATLLSLPDRKRTRSSSSRQRYEIVTELGPEEVRWFYREEKKTWKPFIGYDSLRIELAYRKLYELSAAADARGGEFSCLVAGDGEEEAAARRHLNQASSPLDDGVVAMEDIIKIEPVCVRSGLYEVDVAEGECYPVYWNQTDKIPVMRGQWFIDGTWLPLEEAESNLIEEEHLAHFRGQQIQDNFDMEVAKTVDRKDASSSGTRLHRGYVEEATFEDKPPQATHIVFVVHGIGQKMEEGRIIKNTAMMRETARKIEEKHFASQAGEHVEFLPVEWRSKLTLDGDTVDSITPDKVRGLRDILNSSAMDIMYYTSPLYRDELVKGLQRELNRLYMLFCSRNPEFEETGGKVSIVSHSLGCVITYDIMTGWNPVQFYEQMMERDYEELGERWLSYEEHQVLQDLFLTKQRLKKLEQQLEGLKTPAISKTPTLRFKVENFFCMGSPLAVFLALRGIRPGNSGSQDHILPKIICKRFFNIFHPTDPVAYRVEPLILKHYSNIAPVQIHWYNTTNPTPYNHLKISFINPFKEPTSIADTESIPSPSTSPVLPRRHYGESITNIGKASILGAASIGKGLGGMLFSRFARSSAASAQTSEMKDGTDEEEKTSGQHSVGTQTFPHSTSGSLDPLLELEHRIDFELREGLVESRYWSAVTSHTAYWSSLDVALFLLTFMYKHDQVEEEQNVDPD
ncbi:phospholipase DDHD1 isoform X2 [Rhinatrema bivittatum]|uniref:phospholipase DDHD1 isoform X2 n=1 Tax=Rhinatrema bivittatum TaxID=194408 RepID=UPI00112AB0E6|nr:phospholipase DDHD1 isoform X2 [Rhinatrema bivittatum]